MKADFRPLTCDVRQHARCLDGISHCVLALDCSPVPVFYHGHESISMVQRASFYWFPGMFATSQKAPPNKDPFLYFRFFWRITSLSLPYVEDARDLRSITTCSYSQAISNHSLCQTEPRFS